MIARPQMLVRRHGDRGEALRFHSSDGWTRDMVRDMLESKNIRKVVPRFHDTRDDVFINNSLMTEDTDISHKADFYGVYDFNENFIESRLEKCQIV